MRRGLTGGATGAGDPYGQPFGMPAGDTNFDGDFESGAGDKVVEQTVTLYESEDSSVVLVSATISRPHSDTGSTGSLDSGADADETTFTQANLNGRLQAVSVILRTTYTGTGQSLVEDKRFYYAQNWRADVSVVLDDAGVQQERVIYSTCGQPFAMPAGDTNFDGDFEAGVDGDELADWDINGVPYRAYADVNLDGDIDGDDATAASEHELGWNVLTSDGASGVNNRLGYAGYIHDRDVATAAHVRYRVYKIDLGRWVQRDPAGYIDSMSLYGYVSSQPNIWRDPSGLRRQAGSVAWMKSEDCSPDPCRWWRNCDCECPLEPVPILQWVDLHWKSTLGEYGCGGCRFTNGEDHTFTGPWRRFEGPSGSGFVRWVRGLVGVSESSSAGNSSFLYDFYATAFSTQVTATPTGTVRPRVSTLHAMVVSSWSGTVSCPGGVPSIRLNNRGQTQWTLVGNDSNGNEILRFELSFRVDRTWNCASVYSDWLLSALIPLHGAYARPVPREGIGGVNTFWIGTWCCEWCVIGGR